MGDERERAKYLTHGGPPKPAFALSESELEAMVARAVVAAVAPAPRLLDRGAIAAALSCSPATVDKLRRAGMPCLYLGDSPRFDVEDCIAWLRQRGHSND